MEIRAGRFRRYAWLVLGYTVLVVLWGAFVRATGSGAGCGGHWPLCNGEIAPRSPSAQTVIEYTHRISSGLLLLMTGGLLVWAYRLFPRGHRARRFSALAAVFLGMEALLGAGLVLLDYVAHNASTGRAVYLSAHLTNTLILLAMVALAAWSARETAPAATRRRVPSYLKAALPVALLVAITGALAALGDTLFPATDLASGIRQELAPAAHPLLRLRLLHPVAALAGGIYLALAAALSLKVRPVSAARSSAVAVVSLVFLQLAAGVVNMVLLAPVWMQLVHLLLSVLLWICLVILTAEMSVERLSLREQLAG
ncbi:MAG: COX15/CtaA family protein [Bryobacteraceae bacterium]